MLRRRQIYHIAGYDPVTPADFYARFARQIKIFENTWGLRTSVSPIRASSEHWNWAVDAIGPNWHVQLDFDLWRWDDIVDADAKGSQIVRLLRAFVTYIDLLFTGTMYRYLKANQRYFMFALVPMLEIALFVITGFLVGSAFTRVIDVGSTVAIAITVIATLIGLFLLLRWPGRHWRVEQALDDWNFSRDYIRGRRLDMERRLDNFAAVLAARAQAHAVDEIVLVGHSFGAIFAVEIAARALARDPELGRHGVPISILTVGATIPKCALHPAARRVRERVAQVAHEPSIHWAEYQSRGDPISFYKFDPASLRRIDRDRLDSKPIIRRVQIHDMLQPATFARYRFRALRLHYQSVMANDRRAPYDYFVMACGPVPSAAWTVSPGGLLDFINIDGSIRTDRDIEAAQ